MLKQSLLILALAGASFAATAQVTVVDVEASTEPAMLKPTTGTNGLEIQVNPFNFFFNTSTSTAGSSNFGLSNSGPGAVAALSGIKFRHFSSPTSALRLVANISYSRDSRVTQPAGTDGNNDVELRDIVSDFTFAIKPGIEKHFATGSRHISPYVGGEIAAAIRLTRLNSQTQEDGSAVDNIFTNGGSTDNFTLAPGGLTLGLNGLAGVDIYLAKGFYIGTELGYGIAYFTPFDTKFKPNTGDEVTTTQGKENNLTIQPYVQSSFRLGFNF